jgi:hypothetical protein
MADLMRTAAVVGVPTGSPEPREAVTSYALRWTAPSEALPPRPPSDLDSSSSDTVWLALSDGRVVRGSCTYRPRNATYAVPVHAWWENNRMVPEGVEVMAWMPFAVPDHPFCFPSPEHGAAK